MTGIDKSIKDNKNQTAEELLLNHNSAMSKSLLQILRGALNLPVDFASLVCQFSLPTDFFLLVLHAPLIALS